MGQQIEFALRQSIQRIVLVLVKFLPGVLALLLALVLFILIGWALAALLRRILTAVGFDQRLASREDPSAPAVLADWSPSNSPTLLASRITFWLCVLAGIAVGISALDASYAANSQYSIFLLPYVAHLAGAVLILLVGSLAARFLARTVLIGAVNAQLHYARFLSLGIKWLVLVLTVAMALDHLHIGGSIVSLAFGILFGGIVLTLSLAIGLGSRELVSRSIEKSFDKSPERPGPVPVPTDTTAESRPRHF
jgi:hypothetical protein